MKTEWGEIKTVQIDEYYHLDADKINVPIQIIFGSRERGKTSEIEIALYNQILYKKYRTRISHLTHTRRKICQRKKCH